MDSRYNRNLHFQEKKLYTQYKSFIENSVCANHGTKCGMGMMGDDSAIELCMRKGFSGLSVVKNPPGNARHTDAWVQSLGQEDPLE